MFNNTWPTNMATAKKKRFSALFHFNNAIVLHGADGKPLPDPTSVFGGAWQVPADPRLAGDDLIKSEEKRFTKRWEELDIHFDSDTIEHPNFPDAYRIAGYPLGPESRSQQLSLRNGSSLAPEGLKLNAPPTAIWYSVVLPDGNRLEVGGDEVVIGAWQKDGLITLATAPFENAIRPKAGVQVEKARKRAAARAEYRWPEHRHDVFPENRP